MGAVALRRVCIDVGGTFTDCLVLEEGDSPRAFKAPTTPKDPTAGFLESLSKAASFYQETVKEFLTKISLIVHGTTLATNKLLTGQGAVTGMLTTENFPDTIEIRRGQREPGISIYNWFTPRYQPLVPRHLRLEVPERIRYTGEVITPLDRDALRRAAHKLRDKGVESVAICFLHSYINPEHELEAVKVCKEVFGDGYVTASHKILPVWREFERFSTTVVSAYVGPVVSTYLTDLEKRLAEAGFSGSLLMMLSNGLTQPIEDCVERAVSLLSSGPAAAPSGALRLTSEMGSGDLLSIDMGGTSLDICLIRDGEIPTTTDGWVGGHRVAIKMVDVESIGAGGGSIAWIDSLGLLRVGPQSAGADPGPACYGKGSEAATVTDADLILGYIPTDFFLGGEIGLDASAARAALQRIGEKLGLNVEATAQAVFNTVNSYMADQILELCTKRGQDVRELTLIGGGGAGPIHAPFIAEQLGIKTVVVPPVAALYSAFGMFTMDLGRDFARSHVARAASIDLKAVANIYDQLEADARGSVERLATGGGAAFTRTAEMRYSGQYHEVEVALPSGPISPELIDEAIARFHKRHEALYTFSMPWRETEFLTFRLRATVPRAEFKLRKIEAGGPDPSGALKRRRSAVWGGAISSTPVYAGEQLRTGNQILGPAIIEEQTTTVLVPQRFVCEVDATRNFILRHQAVDTVR
jgi:N-methylhydantoinase A